MSADYPPMRILTAILEAIEQAFALRAARLPGLFPGESPPRPPYYHSARCNSGFNTGRHPWPAIRSPSKAVPLTENASAASARKA